MTESEYKVRLLKDSKYQVVRIGLIEGQSWDEWDDHYGEETVFQGSLSDCEAYIRLNENGYMN